MSDQQHGSNPHSFGKLTGSDLNKEKTKLRLFFEFPPSHLDPRTIRTAVAHIPRVDPGSIQVKIKDDVTELSLAVSMSNLDGNGRRQAKKRVVTDTLLGLHRLIDRTRPHVGSSTKETAAVTVGASATRLATPPSSRPARRSPQIGRQRRS